MVMIPLDEALQAYKRVIAPLSAETVPTVEALHRVLARDVASTVALPRFDQSALDGYAFRAADTLPAATHNPVKLPITLRAAAGDPPSPLPLGNAARVLTGAPIPTGADTVIGQENAMVDGGALYFSDPQSADRNVRWAGEELSAGTLVAAAGQRIHAGLLSSLINAGCRELSVVRAPRIRVLVTGNELYPSAQPEPSPGMIPDSNTHLISGILRSWGLAAPVVELLRDDAETIRAALDRALAAADLVISSGGASVGDFDFMPATAKATSVERIFHGVAQKPGKPLYFGVRGSSAYLGLPGNPGAVLVGMTVHARALLDCLEGLSHGESHLHWNPGRLRGEVERDGKRTHLLRMRMEFGAGGVSDLFPLGGQDSHMLSNLAHANALVLVDPGEGGVRDGEEVRWISCP